MAAFVNFFVNVLFFLCLSLFSVAEKINVTKEAFAITQENCAIIKNENTAPAIMFAAADLVIIGKSGTVGKTYGDGNSKYEISVTPHCILKGNTDQKTLTVRNMGRGSCGATDVEKNDLMPYLFFLRATSDAQVFNALNLGAKRIIEPAMVWGPAFVMFCGVTNKKTCAGSMCAKACSFDPRPAGECIPYEQNVIDEIKKEQAKRKAMMTTTTAPPPPPTTTMPPTTTTKVPPPTTTTTTTTITTTPVPTKPAFELYEKGPPKSEIASAASSGQCLSPVLLMSIFLVLFFR